jgi:hypothetical protein
VTEPPSFPGARLDRGTLVAGLLVGVAFALHGAQGVPTPSEVTYLAKGRHLWDPAFAAGDFYLGTGDAHLAFYAALCWPSRLLPPGVFAWTLRLAGWALLAVGWTRLARRVVGGPFAIVATALLWLAAQSHLHLSGEWVVSHAEAKVFAYGCVLLALAEAEAQQWGRVTILAALAIVLHAVVGGWAALALGVVYLMADRRERPWWWFWQALACGGLIAALGLLPGLLLDVGTPATVTREAHAIQVFSRLRHHLNPAAFAAERWLAFGALALAWAALAIILRREPRARRTSLFAAAALGITCLGLVIFVTLRRQPDLMAGLLRGYWFRLADTALPLAAALSVGLLCGRLPPRARVGALAAALVVGGVALGLRAYGNLARPVGPAVAGQYPGLARDPERRRAWRATCDWARRSTRTDARFVTPAESFGFLWLAERGEVVSLKNMPQDARGLVAWAARARTIHGMTRLVPQGVVPADGRRLLALARTYGADYIVAGAEVKLPLAAALRNPYYVVYRVRPQSDLQPDE